MATSSPKIALKYVGSDQKMKDRLEATKGVAYFEPIDAREILATPGQKDYEIDDESRQLIGLQYDPNLQGLNVPQLQGGDVELQTGHSHDKYKRDQVVQAVPGAMQPSAMPTGSPSGRPLNLEDAQAGKGVGDPALGMQVKKEEPPKAASEDYSNADEMKAALKARNIQFPSDAKKAELAELVDRHNVRKA